MLRRAPRWGQQVVEVRRTAQAFVGSGVSVPFSLENRISRVPAAAGQSMKFAMSAVVCRGVVCIPALALATADATEDRDAVAVKVGVHDAILDLLLAGDWAAARMRAARLGPAWQKRGSVVTA